MKFIVLASGKGTTLESLLTLQSKGQLQPQICALVTDNSKAEALQVASRYNIPAQCIPQQEYSDYASWDAALLAYLNKHDPDFILLAGFLKKVGPKVLNKFHNKMINSHPSLLPKYGGRGMYGQNVHAAVLAAKESKSGVTIHLLNERFDEGPILKQVEVPVLEGDSVKSLEERVKAAEKSALVDFLNSQYFEQ
ncbi:MAG: phosphoribosylglycinamide formyltransferase [Bdellovibrionales bacterium]|nr:phosphoribosylglycinamide formyltransferase [Bdellovibrionales bacterium]